MSATRPQGDADGRSLEDFALKGMHLAKMTGVSTATHAIGDGFLLMHSGVGCKYKTATWTAQHDWVRHPNRREAWTQVGEVSLVKGSAERIGPFARTWYERRRPGFMTVVSAYFIELTGEDVRHVVKETGETLPCPMGVVATSAPNGGFFDGYSSVVLEVMKTLDFTGVPARPDDAAVLGFFFHRYEADQQADLTQLKQLLKIAGVGPGPALFSGRNYAELAEAAECGWIIKLPYMHPQRRRLKRMLKRRRVVELDLPMGIGGTSRFVRELAACTRTDRRKVEAWIHKRVSSIQPHLDHLSGLRGLRVAVFADTPLAVGLVTILRELGVELAMVGLRDDVLGGPEAFQASVEKNGVRLNDDCEVVRRPSLRRIRQWVLDTSASGELQAVIGSAIELNALSHAVSVRGALSRLALIETGYPSKDHHAALGVPSFGYTGVLVWAQRLLDAVMTPRLGARGGPR